MCAKVNCVIFRQGDNKKRERRFFASLSRDKFLVKFNEIDG